MKKIATDAIRACSGSIDPTRMESNFEIFGLDFMIDENYKLYLIEINTNPCLELSCPLLSGIIPRFIETTLEYFAHNIGWLWIASFLPLLDTIPKECITLKTSKRKIDISLSTILGWRSSAPAGLKW